MQRNSAIQIEPRGQVAVRVGDSLTIRCRLPLPLSFCRVEVPTQGSLVITNPSQSPSEIIRYAGNGLDKGECDILIVNVKAEYNGTFKCSLLPRGSSYEAQASTDILIASKYPVAIKIFENLKFFIYSNI